MVAGPRTPAGSLKMNVRLPEWCVANMTARRSCEGRIRKVPRIPQSTYPERRIFGIIYVFLGWCRNALSEGRRSLTAAQAANDFTRNCVLGFRRKRPIFLREARYGVSQSAFRALCVPPSMFLLRCLGVPRLRCGERYALSLSSGFNSRRVVSLSTEHPQTARGCAVLLVRSKES